MMEALLVATGDFSVRLRDLQLAIGLKRNKTSFPIATFLINITGAFTRIYNWQRSHYRLAIIIRYWFMGAFTTFSTFKLESVQLLNRKSF